MRLFEAILDANHRALAGDANAGVHPTDFADELPLVALTCIDPRLNPLMPGDPRLEGCVLDEPGHLVHRLLDEPLGRRHRLLDALDLLELGRTLTELSRDLVDPKGDALGGVRPSRAQGASEVGILLPRLLIRRHARSSSGAWFSARSRTSSLMMSIISGRPWA